MKSNIKYNYIFLFYDISDQESDKGKNRVNKVFKICKKYLEHFQKSVFRGSITISNQLKIEQEISKVIEKELDTVTIIKVINTSAFKEINIGKSSHNKQNLFL